jgi:PAS domain S-box-containing protein
MTAPDFAALGATLAASDNAVFLIDTQCRIGWANEAFARLTGADPATVLGRAAHSVIVPDAAEHDGAFARAVAAGQPARLELSCRDGQGDRHWLETQLLPQHDAGGALTGFICIGVDVTQRVLAADLLLDSRAFLEQAQQLVSVGGWEVDLETLALKMSPQVLRIFELPPHSTASIEDFIGYFDAASQARIREATARCIRTGEPWSMELSLVSAAGHPRWVRTVGEVVRRGSRSVRLIGTLQDFTERQEVDDELRRSHLQLRGIIESLPCGVSVFDSEMRLLVHNDRYVSLYGYPQDLVEQEVVRFDDLVRYGAAIGEYGPDDIDSQVRRATAQVLSRAVFTLQVRSRSGRELEVRRAPMPGGGFVLTHTDVTDRSQAARALRKSLKELADLKAALDEHAIVAVTDRTGRILSANEKFRAISKYSEQELIGQDQRITGSGHHPREFFQQLWDTVRGGRVWRGDICERARDGTQYWVTTTIVPFLDEKAEPYQYVVIRNDITDRKQAEEALRASERLMRLVTDNIPGRVGYWDRELRCVFGNRAYLELLGPAAHEIVGRTALEIFGSRRFEAERGRVEAALRGERQLFEREERGADGRRRTMYVHYIPDWKVNEIEGFFVLALDITELKEARDAAQQATAAKAQFLANTSHEIRTPMNAIIGMLTLLEGTALTPRQLDYVSKAGGAARALLGLLNDLLDFSKIEAGKMTLDVRAFSVDTLLRELSVILAANMRSERVEVLFDVDPALPPMLRGDDMRLRQILINLGGNAIKFTQRGEVVVAVRLQACEGESALLEFSVRDSGIGIAPEHQAAIFDGFRQAEASTGRRYGGTGLGLAISQRLVRLMGGELLLESAPGQGSRFFFTIRLALAAAAAPPTAGPERLRALFIDDNAVARQTLAAQARTLGWTVDVAATGEEGLALLRAAPVPYEVVFVDWLMPGLDGLETSRQLRALPGLGDLPLVIMVTAQERARLAQHPAPARAALNGYIVKPVTASMLHDAVREARELPDPARRDTAVAPEQSLAGLRLLVVDDNANNQQIARELLVARGAHVEVAGDGRTGVAMAPSFDLVLMDVQMPGMDGYAATREIRTLPGCAKLPVIAMTANAMASDREAAAAAGMNDHIAKPFDIADLVATILHHTGRGPGAVAPAVTTGSDDALPHDVQGALARLGGDVALYRTIIPMFRSDGEGITQQLPALLASGRREEAQRLLHSLKGLSGTVGAVALARVAQEGESAMAQPASAQDEPLLLAISDAFAQACAGIQDATSTLTSDAPTAGDLGAMRSEPTP